MPVQTTASTAAQSRKLVAQKSFDKAISSLTNALKAQPTSIDLFMARSYAYGAKGDFAKAEEDRMHFVRLDGAHQKENLTRSLRDFELLAKSNPNNLNAHLNIGDINTSLVNYVEARKSIERALKIDANSPWGHYGLGQIATAYKDYKQALASFNRLIALRPKSAWGYDGRGTVLVLQDKYAEALPDFNRAVALEPSKSLSYSGRGMALVMSGKYEAAHADLKRALTLDPLNERAYVYRALGHLYKGETYAARDNLNVAIALDPHDAFAYYLRGVALNESNRYSEAAADFSQAIANDPKYAAAYRERGVVQQWLTSSNPALKTQIQASLNKAVELDPKDALAYSSRASFYRGEHKHQLAVDDYSKALQIRPSNVDDLRMRAYSYSDLGEREKAAADYRQILVLEPNNSEAKLRLESFELDRAIRADPQNADLYAKRAAIYSPGESPSLRDQGLALKDYDMAIQLAPSNAVYWFKRAKAREQKEALPDLQHAIELDPGYAAAYIKRAEITTEQDKVIADLTRAIQIDPKNSFAFWGRAAAYRAQDDYPRAIADYNSAIQLSPQDSHLYYQRGLVYIALGEYEKASADFARAPAGVVDASEKSHLKRLKELQQAIAAQPQKAENYVKRVEYLVSPDRRYAPQDRLGETSLILSDLDKAISLNPKLSKAYELRGRHLTNAFYMNEDWKQIIANYSQALLLEPNQADVLLARARAHMHAKQFDASVADYCAAAQEGINHVPGLQADGAIRFDSAFTGAVDHFTQLITRNPRGAKAYFQRGIIQADSENWKEAIADYTQAIRLDPKMTLAWLFRGVAQEKLELLSDGPTKKKALADKALADYDTAIRLNPRLSPAYLLRAELLREKNPHQAIASFTTFLKLSPQHKATVYSRRGVTYGNMKNWNKAIADYEVLLKLPSVVSHPNDFVIERQWLREAYVAQGNYDKAITSYSEILKTTPANSSSWLLIERGRAYLLRGDIQKAIADFNKSLSSTPTLAEAYKNRAAAYRQLGQFERAGSDEALAEKTAKNDYGSLKGCGLITWLSSFEKVHNMLSRVLNNPPVSGSITERHYHPFGSCTWVQFSSPEGEEWAGVFGNGSFGNHSCATVFNDEQSVLIGAKGNSYIVDLQSGALLYQPAVEIIGAIAVPQSEVVIAYDYCYLYALNSAHLIWESDRVALDGIRLIEATKKWLNGEVWQIDGWYKFTLHLDSWSFTQGQATGEK